jgi:hypothetical protein
MYQRAFTRPDQPHQVIFGLLETSLGEIDQALVELAPGFPIASILRPALQRRRHAQNTAKQPDQVVQRNHEYNQYPQRHREAGIDGPAAIPQHDHAGVVTHQQHRRQHYDHQD